MLRWAPFLLLTQLEYMESLLSIYAKGTKRKLLKFFGLETSDPYMKFKEIDFFSELLINLKPVKCLEYGCGTSTAYYMSHLQKGSKWISVEHHKGWYDKISEVINHPDLSLHYVDITSATDIENDNYATFPKQFGQFDLILVDGIRRENCVEMAHDLLAVGGVLVVHDSNRIEYHSHIKKFKSWVILEDFRKSAGGLGLASNTVDVTKLVDLEAHAKLWKKDTAVSNFFKFKFILGKKVKKFRLQTSN